MCTSFCQFPQIKMLLVPFIVKSLEVWIHSRTCLLIQIPLIILVTYWCTIYFVRNCYYQVWSVEMKSKKETFGTTIFQSCTFLYIIGDINGILFCDVYASGKQEETAWQLTAKANEDDFLWLLCRATSWQMQKHFLLIGISNEIVITFKNKTFLILLETSSK